MGFIRLLRSSGEFLRLIDHDEARKLVSAELAFSRRSRKAGTLTEVHLKEERPLLHFPIGRQPVYREHMEYGRPWTFRRVWKAAQVTA